MEQCSWSTEGGGRKVGGGGTVGQRPRQFGAVKGIAKRAVL
jgi:hypothetical protein